MYLKDNKGEKKKSKKRENRFKSSHGPLPPPPRPRHHQPQHPHPPPLKTNLNLNGGYLAFAFALLVFGMFFFPFSFILKFLLLLARSFDVFLCDSNPPRSSFFPQRTREFLLSQLSYQETKRYPSLEIAGELSDINSFFPSKPSPLHTHPQEDPI